MSIYRGAGGAGDAVADSASEALLVRELAIEVQADADAAAASATAAAGSASTASTQATNSSNSATAAATSATNASNSATAASNSASTATTQATNASNSATAAQTAETNAETAETNAETAETNAAASASTATTQATNASNSASAASTSATNASNSASAASTSATNAANSATSASGSASTATTQASNASTSASNAATSETNAATSASTATTQAGIATTQASNASTSATNASNSATAASGSASSASTSATNAASAQTAAESARDATLAAYDSFDDRYLGAKSSAPTLDNDGNALVGGALYFDTVSQGMKVYTGSAWVDAYVPGSTYLAKASNLSDVSNKTAAMANLMGFTTTVTSATPVVLTNTSSYYQVFTGSTAQTITLPVTSTLQQGWTFHICNNSTGTLTIQSSGGNVISAFGTGLTVMITCIATGGTGIADWEFGYTDFSNATGTGAVVLGTSPTIGGTLAITGAINASTNTSALLLGSAQTTGILTAGGASGTGIMTLGQSTVSQTTNIQAGATASGSTKTVNFGTGGLAGSTTNIAIGSTDGTAITANGQWTYSTTGSIKLPAGTTAQRNGTPTAGMIRYNSSTSSFEGYTTAWGSIGGGATGAGGDTVFQENSRVVTTSYTLTAGKSASTVGPITINSGAVLTIPSGERLVIL